MIKLTNMEFEELISFVKINFGIDLATRKVFVETRLQKLMTENKYTDFKSYFEYVCSDFTGVAAANFISGLTVNYTLFYRESYQFNFFTETVLPELVESEAEKKDLRIWSAGCSTGEEPYTISMLINDYFGTDKWNWDTTILATDISMFALQKAVEGIYPIESIENLNPEWINKYFIFNEDQETVSISPKLKNEVIFRKQNLMSYKFNFKQKFHAIFCRNVMIYFDEPTRYALIEKFYDHLCDGGYLFIGVSETIDRNNSKFKYIMPSIYKKEKNI
ncbi:chemotaxis protein CheR [Eubacteriales bacterium OttesenSCG-928-G02]|nr:chemotaxis protein CheR [Eubacteriales bacterium OttesenSCG-928-G02]